MEYTETFKNIVSQLKQLTIKELDSLVGFAREERNEKFNNTYKTVEVFPGSRIETKITEETGFYCYHVPCHGYSSGRGTHVIVIPKECYTEGIDDELISKYGCL